MAHTSLPLRVAAAAAALAAPASALANGAALTPPMGFSTWNAIRCNFTASDLLEAADALARTGMVAAGYTSFNIDDCWPLKERDASGAIVPDPARFPDGMLAFSRALQQRGMRLGIYTAHGNYTCQMYPGSYGHEEADARLYAGWEVDFVKNDWCWHDEADPAPHLAAFNRLRDALGREGQRTGRPMSYSIHWNMGDSRPPAGCVTGENCPLPAVANMWRVGNDIRPRWETGVLRLVDQSTSRAAAAGPGAWNDADMLEVGNGMTADQDRGHFTMWCIMAAPLVSGNDPRTQSAETTRILTNKLAIAVNQDPAGHQARLVQTSWQGQAQVYVKRLASGDLAVAMLNRGSFALRIQANYSSFGPDIAGSYNVFDVWNNQEFGLQAGYFAATVPATSAGLYILTKSAAEAILL